MKSSAQNRNGTDKHDTISNGIEMNREETRRAEKESNGQVVKGTATETYGYDRIEQDRNGKAKHGRARKRKRKATQRTAAEWHRIATTGPETEKQKYRAGGIRQKGR